MEIPREIAEAVVALVVAVISYLLGLKKGKKL